MVVDALTFLAVKLLPAQRARKWKKGKRVLECVKF